MGTIRRMLLGVQAIKLRENLPDLIRETSGAVLSLNRFQLFNQSVDKTGEPLKFYSSLSYALEKNKINPLPGFGRPDLYLTGSFQRAMYVEVNSQSIKVWSRDSKTDDLIKKYSEDIFGMSPESKGKYAKQTLYPAIQNHITVKSGIRFR
jgi:hypothetical protein